MPTSSSSSNMSPSRPPGPPHSLSAGSVSKARRLFRGVSGYLNTSGNHTMSVLASSAPPLLSSMPQTPVPFGSSPDLSTTATTSRHRSQSIGGGPVKRSATTTGDTYSNSGNNNNNNNNTNDLATVTVVSSSDSPVTAVAGICQPNFSLDTGFSSPTTPKNYSLIDLAYSNNPSSFNNNLDISQLAAGSTSASFSSGANTDVVNVPDVSLLELDDQTTSDNVVSGGPRTDSVNNGGSLVSLATSGSTGAAIEEAAIEEAAIEGAPILAAAAPTVTAAEPADNEFSIRLTPFLDHSSTAPALYFEPVVRRAPNGVVIKVGRYSDKDEDAQKPKDQASIVFRSKVVSRAHAEILITNDKWFIRDVKSSSGTFLNHVRLSPANVASAPFAIRDGDVLQLGMDFRGGEEAYYKSVKVRVEINRSWQRRANKFNVSAMSKLKNLTGVAFPEAPISGENATITTTMTTTTATTTLNDNNSASASAQECSICLVPIAPCQALFIAPCSHVWHYKCCRLLIIKAYPQFECPNCRAICDLEEDIDDAWNAVH